MNTPISKTRKVVAVSLNPAIDLTGSLTELQLGTVNSIAQAESHPAGKGLNVAHVLADLGAEVTITGFLGEDNAAEFTQRFKQLGLTDRTVQVQGATRINVKLVEQNSAVTDLNFPGFAVTEKDINQLEEVLFELADTHDYIIITGSLPKQFPVEKLSEWIAKLHQMNKRVIFDSSREALKQGVQAKPWLIKPNHEELAEFAGRVLASEDEYLAVAKQLLAQGLTHILISKGSDGVLWVSNDGVIAAKPPKMSVVSTVGAGDTLVAGLCWAMMQQFSRENTLQFATALSALAVSQIGVGVTDMALLESTQQAVVISA